MGSRDQTVPDPDVSEQRSELSFPELIIKKREGLELTKKEIQRFVDGVIWREIQESQIGAMLMAIFMKGMSMDESSNFTMSMMKSGEVLHWPEAWNGLIVDKHSTGGVGDKISLPLAPALAACGLKVPMISGRGLSFSGGTLDKLESIPGYNVYHSTESMRRILEDVGCCIVGQTDALVPADKKLYAVRDVTGTVESIPLVTASIISKKGAEGLNSLVLDVKTGSGAFFKNEEAARALALRMVRVGNSTGMKVTALLTSMDRPIGRMIGNSMEIAETIECLHGKGPRSTRELTEWEGGYLLYNVGKATSPEDGAQMIRKALDDGSAMDKFCQMLKAQGVCPDVADKLCAKDADPFSVLPKASHTTNIPALASGHVDDLDAYECGMVSFHLGAGRTKSGDPVDHAVGLVLHVECGDIITKGASWVTVHHNQDLPAEYIGRLQNAIKISASPPDSTKYSLIKDVIEE